MKDLVTYTILAVIGYLIGSKMRDHRWITKWTGRKLEMLFVTTAVMLFATGSNFTSQLPEMPSTYPVDYGVIAMNENITRSNISEQNMNPQVKVDKDTAFDFFDEQRNLSEEESHCYKSMIDELSHTVGVNVLDLL